MLAATVLSTFVFSAASLAQGSLPRPAPVDAPPNYIQTAQKDSPADQEEPGKAEPAKEPGKTKAKKAKAKKVKAKKAKAGKAKKGAFKPGFYLDLGGGVTFFKDSDLEDDPFLTNNNLTGTLSADIGFNVNGAIGYWFGEFFRSDLEIGYRRNSLDDVKFGGFGLTASAPVDGTVSALSLLLNGYFELPLGSTLIPFLGAGIGSARVQIDSDDLSTDDSEYMFAYQLSGGLKYALSPRASLRTAYKLFLTSNDFLKTSDERFGTTEVGYMTHSIELGLTYNF